MTQRWPVGDVNVFAHIRWTVSQMCFEDTVGPQQEVELWKVRWLPCEVAGSRKEAHRASTGTIRLCLFSKSLRGDFREQKKVAAGGVLLKNLCQAFIVTADIYRNAGIPWLWFTCRCPVFVWRSFEEHFSNLDTLNQRTCCNIRGTWMSIILLVSLSFSFLLYLKHSHTAAVISSVHVKVCICDRKKTAWMEAQEL